MNKFQILTSFTTILITGCQTQPLPCIILFSQRKDQEERLSIIQPDGRFIELYTSLFGNPWEGAVEPSPPKNLEQPEMILPFLPGHKWTFSEGLLPCSLGGWQAVELPEPYKGALINGEQTITSCQCSTANTKISRPRK